MIVGIMFMFEIIGRTSLSRKAFANSDMVFPEEDVCNAKRNSFDSLEDAKVAKHRVYQFGI